MIPCDPVDFQKTQDDKVLFFYISTITNEKEGLPSFAYIYFPRKRVSTVYIVVWYLYNMLIMLVIQM